MSNIRYLIVHKDHLLDVRGVNSGAEMATLNLARFLSKAGKQVVVAGILKEQECQIDGIEFWDLGKSFDVTSVLTRISALGKYHLISGGRAQAILESRYDQNCISRSLISHDRQGNDTGIDPKVLAEVADNIISVSDAQSQIFRIPGVDQSKIKVIHNGVDLDLFKAGITTERNLERLIFVGALIADKGIQVIIPVFNKLKAKYPKLEFDVYGSAALWGREALFDERQVEQSCPGIKFHGGVKQDVIAKAYANAGICVVPSIWFDPFPLTAIEAQVCGCPVVAFNVGGLSEGLRHQETGLIVDDISENGLYQALDSLLSEQNKLRQMSENALKTARAYFNWERVAANIIEITEIFESSRLDKVTTTSQTGISSKKLIARKIGVLSTWNQQCGLATYARYMFEQFPAGTYHVFAEQLVDGTSTTQADESNVTRCWQRGVPEYEKLYRAVIEQKIGVLHLNCHYRFFPQPFFADFIRRIQSEGVKVIALIHSAFTLDPQQQQLVESVDRVIVHGDENRLEVIGNGAEPAKVFVIPHGVDVRPEIAGEAKIKLREKLSLAVDKKIIVSFGFVQPHKGMEAVIEGVAHLKKRNIQAQGVIAGTPMKEDPGSTQYLVQLRAYAEKLGVLEDIIFLNRFLETFEVTEYLQAADLVMMNYHSQYYEASGACSLALGAGALVATSIAPAFQFFKGAVWHMTSGYPAGLTSELLLTSKALATDILEQRQEFCKNYSWQATAKKVQEIYAGVGVALIHEDLEQSNKIPENNLTETKENVVKTINSTNELFNKQGALKILIQNRQNTFTQPGGDTVVINKLKSELEQLGHHVSVDTQGTAKLEDFDIVHLFNFATPETTRVAALRASASGVPYVVTTLCEDVPSFHNQSRAVARSLVSYVNTAQQRDWYENNKIDISTIERSPRFQNDWTVRHAARLIANGEAEKKVLQRDYPGTENIEVVKLAHEYSYNSTPDLFISTYGVKDFVLCVGRLESRKNQLMLLKALEDSELPVVLAAGGFSYQPEYEWAVKNFRRKGQTIVLDRLSDELLASAYAAAKVHALPSWYELPGLVSLEAAAQGCNVVVSNTGTTRDYFKDQAFYCQPDDEQSIANAVLAAYFSPFRTGLKQIATEYGSWKKVAEETLAIYADVLGITVNAPVIIDKTTQDLSTVRQTTQTALKPETSIVETGYDFAGGITQLQEILEKAEIAAKSKEFDKAQQLFDQVLAADTRSVRALRGKGAIAIAQANFNQAKKYFDRAYVENPTDPKTLSGLGMCNMNVGNAESAYDCFVESLQHEPYHLVTILQLVEASYYLKRFDDLERVLRIYSNAKPQDVEMKFCLAGACFKLNKLDEAKALCEQVLKVKPNHVGAMQVNQEIDRLFTENSLQNAGETTVATPTEIIETQYHPNIAPAGVQRTNKESVPVVQVVATRETEQQIDPRSNAKLDSLVTPLSAVDMEIMGIEEAKRRKKYDEVLQRVSDLKQRAEVTGPKGELLRLVEAEVRGLKGDLNFARTVFEDVLKTNPQSSRALCGKGALAAHAADWFQARNYFTQALTFEPRNDVAFAGLGLCSVCENKQEDAWEYYSKSLAINPENLRAILGIIELGYAFNRLDVMESAITNYLEMHPADIDMLYSLAGCFYKQGRFDEAMEQLDRILLFRPNHDLALELRDVIINAENSEHIITDEKTENAGISE